MATTTNYSWTTPDDTDLVKDGASAIRSLGTAIDSTVFTNAGNAVQKSTIDAKGDLLVGTADNTIGRLAVGTNDYVLTADSNETSGMKWAAVPSPSPSSNWTLVSTSTGSGVASVNISVSGYNRIRIHYQIDNPAGGLTRFRINNSSSNLYKHYVAYYDSYASQTSTGVDLEPFSGLETYAGFIDIDNANSSGIPKYFITGQRNDDKVLTWDGFYDDSINVTSVDFVRSTGNFDGYAFRVWGL